MTVQTSNSPPLCEGARTEAAGPQRPHCRSLGPLLAPRSVAIVGASDRHPAVVRNAQAGSAETWLVNPKRDTILGEPCYRTIADLPRTPDVAVIVVGHQHAEQAARDALAAGAAALVVPGLGAEAGPEGRAIADRIRGIAVEADAPLLGTNCMGLVSPFETSLWIGTPPKALAGHVAVVAQSGSIAEALLASGPRIGFRTVVSSGSEISRDAADFVAAFAADEQTRAIGLFLETVRRPEAFGSALRACAEADKPVVCLKVGRSALAAAVALTHTRAMVGSNRAFSAFLEAHGVIEVFDMPDLVETLEILGCRRRPHGVRLAAVSESGGEAALLADHADTAGLRLESLPDQTAHDLRAEFPNLVHPGNPLDVWAVDEVQRVFSRSFEHLREARAYDILTAQIDLSRFRSEPDNVWCAQVVGALAAAAEGTDLFPAVVSTNSVDPPAEIAQLARDHDIALLRGSGAATRALAAVANWRPRSPTPHRPQSRVDVSELLRDGFLAEFESATLLSRYGVKFAPFRRARSSAEAAAAAEQLGFPVVVKVDNAAHKSVLGGVAIGITSAEAAAQAADRLGGSVLVAAQLPPGPEVICGLLRDPTFGPVVSIGLGGAIAEASGAVATALAPLSPEDATALVSFVPGVGEGAARDDLVVVLGALSRLAAELPEIEAVDINPLLISPDGATAVDALVVVRA